MRVCFWPFWELLYEISPFVLFSTAVRTSVRYPNVRYSSILEVIFRAQDCSIFLRFSLVGCMSPPVALVWDEQA